jgi:hypothetical protein
MANKKDDTTPDLDEDEDVDVEDEDEFDEEDEEGFMDMGGLLTSLLTTEDGDNVCTALVNIGAILNKHMETQNKILVKLLARLPPPKDS